MQIGHMQKPAGNSALRQLILSANRPAPYTKGLQNSCKLVSARVKEINEKDLQEKRKTLIDVNKYRNQSNPNAIDKQILML